MDAAEENTRTFTLRWRATAIIGGLVVMLIAAIAFGERHLKATAERVISARTGRQVRIAGEFQVRLFSAHPRIDVGEVSIGNPTWMTAGATAEVAHVGMVLDWRWRLPPWQIDHLQIDGASLHLVRDEQGRANWHLHEEGPGKGPPLMRSLSMPDAHVDLHDARRHLEFTGTVSASDATAAGDAGPLRIEGAGQLNGRAASLVVLGDPLAEARRAQPYHFTVDERSGASHLHAKGYLEHPFDFRQTQGSFELRGPNMGDVYFLVGLKLPQTAAFEMSGKLARNGMRFEYSDLSATAGQSDVAGSVSVERSQGGRSRIEAQLTSKRLRIADLGAHPAEATDAATPQPGPKMFAIPDKPLKVAGLRKSDATVKFHIRQLQAGRIELGDVSGKLSIENGVLEVTGVQATVAGGALTGSVRLDAAHAVPAGALDIALSGAQLEQLRAGHEGALGGLSGLLSVRAQLKATGTSFRAMAATADGTITAVIPRGTVRAALPEAASLELAGALGLMTKSQKQTAVRCAVASFGAHEGVLSARTVVFDTDKALITMTGDAQLDTETLDFRLRGHPKTATLALRSAVALRGTLAHPQFRLAGDGSAAQTGVAAALGVALAPVAAVLAFVSPGLAHNADCAGLLASAPPIAAAADAPAAK